MLVYQKIQFIFMCLIRNKLADTGLLICGLVSVLWYWKIYDLGIIGEKIPEFFSLYLVVFVLYVIAIFFIRFSSLKLKGRVAFILFFGLIYRLLLLPTAPTLSNDIYRYAWEGYLQTEGISPYQHSPNSKALFDYRNEFWPSVNNKDVPAIYPPMTQIVNAFVFLGFRTIFGFKIAFLIIEGYLIITILTILKLRGQRLERILIYVWNPLVIVEIAGSGHHDVLVVSLLLGALFLIEKRKILPSILFFSGAILSKFYPLIMILTFLKGLSIRYWAILIVSLVTISLPYLFAGKNFFEGLKIYGQNWRFYGSLFPAISDQVSSEAATMFIIMFLLFGLIMIFWFSRHCRLRQMFWLTGAIILFTPTLYPWYLIWMIPYLCFFHNPAWLLLSGLSMVSYEVLIDWKIIQVWQQDPLFVKLQYYPFYGFLLFGFILELFRKFQVNQNKTSKF